MNLTEENIIGVKELNENENISLSDFVPVQKENETEIKKISLEKILLAVSKMTNEQKQILNSALALIDDENISSEKTFSSEKINSQITNKVAEIVANAPEDFDTLKEMSDWISEHQEDATAMNTAILDLQNQIDNASIYSTTETEIGKWVNGKKLYRKCFEIEFTSSIEVNHNLNFDEIISISGSISAYNSSNGFTQSYPLGKIDEVDVLYQIYLTIYKTHFHIIKGSKNTAHKFKMKLIIEYTKK